MTDLPKTEKLYLEDLAVGAEFNSEKYAVLAEEIREFAKNFDPQPFHLDEEAARKTLFEGLVASTQCCQYDHQYLPVKVQA